MVKTPSFMINKRVLLKLHLEITFLGKMEAVSGIILHAAGVFVCLSLASGYLPAHLVCPLQCPGALSEEAAATPPVVLCVPAAGRPADGNVFSRWRG